VVVRGCDKAERKSGMLRLDREDTTGVLTTRATGDSVVVWNVGFGRINVEFVAMDRLKKMFEVMHTL